MAYEYGAKEPEKLKIKDMTDRQKELLLQSDTFCMLPWMHIHAFPDGRAYPCCFGMDPYPVGNVNEKSMKEIFNDKRMKKMRLNMLNNKKSKECGKCYDQEKSGFFSLRLSSNKHFGHLIDFVDSTKADGTADFIIKYWDIRFSNLCNMACRSCGTWFSSNWYEDHKKIHGSDPGHPKIMRAGRSANDIWEQLLEQFDHVEQFYFAGGEPIIMEEHLRILKELDKRKMYHERLIYNTNFTKLSYKKLKVLDLWPEFEDVSVGASLAAMGPRAELIRNGTVWKDIEKNREDMLKKCPQVDFYVSATLSAFNVRHVVDFHNTWVEKGLIGYKDWNMNVVQDPEYYRADILPSAMKQTITEEYEQHIENITPHDDLGRATNGFRSAIKFINANDNTKMLPSFKRYIELLDKRRSQNTLDVFPELGEVING